MNEEIDFILDIDAIEFILPIGAINFMLNGIAPEEELLRLLEDGEWRILESGETRLLE